MWFKPNRSKKWHEERSRYNQYSGMSFCGIRRCNDAVYHEKDTIPLLQNGESICKNCMNLRENQSNMARIYRER